MLTGRYFLDIIRPSFMLDPVLQLTNSWSNILKLLEHLLVALVDPLHLPLAVALVQRASHQKRVDALLHERISCLRDARLHE